MKRPSLRSCLVCRRREVKETLHRFVVSDQGFVWDREHKCPGRGAYLHGKLECLIKANEPSRWERALRRSGGTILRSELTSAISSLKEEVINKV